MTPLTIGEAAARLRAGDLTSVELTRELQQRADRLDPLFGVYVQRFDADALEAAARADAELAAGRDRGPLHGIPIGVKDLFAMREGPTTAQSTVLDPAWGAGRDAVAVRRLREAGAVLTGKLTLSEFAVGPPDPSKPFPVPRNPWDTGTTPGGSSAGAGSGVAAGLVLGALGSDTGGSIRIPAAYCGVSGLKPTFGRVPTSGAVPLGYSMDTVGPVARSARDCALVLSALAGHDAGDPGCVERPVPDYAAALDGALDGVRVGIVKPYLGLPAADSGLDGCFEEALSVLRSAGAVTRTVELPLYGEVRTAAMLTTNVESFTYHRADMRIRWKEYGAGTRLLIGQGALVPAADYVQAQRVRRLAQRLLLDVFRDVDVVVMPTTGTGAFRIDGPRLDVEEILSLLFTQYWNAVGAPVLAVPMGFTSGGLPLGMQVAGRPFEEATVLRVGDAFQQRTDWHLAVPPSSQEEVGA